MRLLEFTSAKQLPPQASGFCLKPLRSVPQYDYGLRRRDIADSVDTLLRTRRGSHGRVQADVPTTGREFSTRIHTDEDSLKKLPDTITKTACLQCGLMHTWWTREARVVPPNK
jgi:hypothetical protein